MLGRVSNKVFLGPAQRRLCGLGLPILTYHKIAEPPAATTDPFLYVTPRRFDEQLAALRRHGFKSASLATWLPANGNAEKQIVITFDDGCRNVLDHGLEPLARHQHRAIQFLVARFIGRRNEWDIAKGDVAETLMDESQVRQWLAAGHEIGSHSATHRNLRHLSTAELREEIFASKKLLEDSFGVAIKHFCYPYGSWNESVRDLVGEAGYQTACTMDFGVNDSTARPLELRRIIPLSSGELLGKIRHRLARKVRGA